MKFVLVVAIMSIAHFTHANPSHNQSVQTKVPLRQKVGEGLQKWAKKIEPKHEVLSFTNPVFELDSPHRTFYKEIDPRDSKFANPLYEAIGLKFSQQETPLKQQPQKKLSVFKRAGTALANSRPVMWVRTKIANGLDGLGKKIVKQKKNPKVESPLVSFENEAFHSPKYDKNNYFDVIPSERAGNSYDRFHVKNLSDVPGYYEEPRSDNYLQIMNKHEDNGYMQVKKIEPENHYAQPQDAYSAVQPADAQNAYLSVAPRKPSVVSSGQS